MAEDTTPKQEAPVKVNAPVKGPEVEKTPVLPTGGLPSDNETA